MAFRRNNFRGFRRGTGGGQRILAKNGAFTRRTRAKIRRLVQVGTPTQRRPQTGVPPPFKQDRPWKRTVRILVAAANTEVHATDICLQEAKYYNPAATASRWGAVKILGFKAYGFSPTYSPTGAGTSKEYISVTLNPDPATHAWTTTSFSSFGDGKQRAMIAVDMPPDVQVRPSVQNAAIMTFLTGELEYIDFYCEFY